MRLIAAVLLGLLLARAGEGQDLPSTDLFHTEITAGDAALSLSAPVNLTGRAGYDNQPAFIPGLDAVLYTSIRDDGQADTYRLFLGSGVSERITRTPESEYSPTPMPDGSGFSVVRVESDGRQRLWRFPYTGGEPSLLIPDVGSVGYQAWIDESSVALFVLGDPPALQVFDFSTGSLDTVAHNIGRSLRPVPGRAAVSFIDKSVEPWQVAVYDRGRDEVARLFETLPGREDHEMLADGSVLMADGNAIFHRSPGDDVWREIARFDDVADITRIAVNETGSALVFVAGRPH